MLKIKASNPTEAKIQGEQIMKDTLACSSCNASKQMINWDSFRFVAFVDKAWIKKNKAEKRVKTVEGLIRHYQKLRETSLERRKQDIKKELKIFASNVRRNKIPRHSLLSFYLTEYNSIADTIEYGDQDNGLYTLHCTDNHYADMTQSDYANGDKVYFLWFDRHF